MLCGVQFICSSGCERRTESCLFVLFIRSSGCQRRVPGLAVARNFFAKSPVGLGGTDKFDLFVLSVYENCTRPTTSICTSSIRSIHGIDQGSKPVSFTKLGEVYVQLVRTMSGSPQKQPIARAQSIELYYGGILVLVAAAPPGSPRCFMDALSNTKLTNRVRLNV